MIRNALAVPLTLSLAACAHGVPASRPDTVRGPLESAGESLVLWRELVATFPPEQRSARGLDRDTVGCKPRELVLWVDAHSGPWAAFGPARVMTCEGIAPEGASAIRAALHDLVAEDPQRSAFACWLGRTDPATELTDCTAQNERDRVLAALRRRIPTVSIGDYACDYASAESRPLKTKPGIH